ncbi:hypothetical protein BLNAU_22027 [Blattamonas nauphoetae]|uniref:Uncharacterized protein n=1 Tax=Blattamonas nauphoetae TaxID=2049346 RepID=A0ABQ9WUQ2_9EUKA|nr:hypothetical protein BLNAU_22027 [Blattamonas nauphoetae]
MNRYHSQKPNQPKMKNDGKVRARVQKSTSHAQSKHEKRQKPVKKQVEIEDVPMQALCSQFIRVILVIVSVGVTGAACYFGFQYYQNMVKNETSAAFAAFDLQPGYELHNIEASYASLKETYDPETHPDCSDCVSKMKTLEKYRRRLINSLPPTNPES